LEEGFPQSSFGSGGIDFALREIKHVEQAQRGFGGFFESEFKSFAVHARLSSKTDRKMRQK
jgi:hypothetical protein